MRAARPTTFDGVLRRTARRCAIQNATALGDPYRLTQALRLALCPVDMWRYREFAAVLEHAPGEGRVLDLGSPRLLAAHVAATSGCRVCSTDISRVIADEVRVYGQAAPESLVGLQSDGAHLPFQSQAFDFAYSVSAIEHFAGDGDSRAMSGIGRILRPGCVFVATVPIHPDGGEVWNDADPFGGQVRDAAGRVFFCRRYSESTFRERLLEPAAMALESVRLYQYVSDGACARYAAATNAPRTLRSIWAKIRDAHWAETITEPIAGWERLARVGVACAVFRAPIS